MADVLSAPFTPYNGWAYTTFFVIFTSMESYVGGDYGSCVRMWRFTTMEFSEIVDDACCKENEG
jgi:hypothetical protein